MSSDHPRATAGSLQRDLAGIRPVAEVKRLVVIINFVSGWRYTAVVRGAPTMLSSDVAVDSTGLRTLNTWALVSFNVYYGLQALIKIWKLWFRSSEKSWMTERKKKMS